MFYAFTINVDNVFLETGINEFEGDLQIHNQDIYK